ncbi:MAG TPA: hypothetical protein VN153_05210 [Tahibacter sp.]|nr:hypothetical protein [Tahibacter sp.]
MQTAAHAVFIEEARAWFAATWPEVKGAAAAAEPAVVESFACAPESRASPARRVVA